MGERMRALDWSKTPLGPAQDWPASLRTALSLMLNSLYPMFIGWGPELILLYNDAYRPVLGARDAAALGRPLAQVWDDVWPEVRGMVERAQAGEATFRKDLHLVVERHGYPEDSWWTFSYSPVRDERGEVCGMFCALSETTAQVQNERRLTFQIALADRLRGADSPEAVKREAARMLGEALHLGMIGFADAGQQEGETWFEIDPDWGDGSMAPAGGRFRLSDFGPAAEELNLGRELRIDDVAHDPRVADVRAAFESLGAGAVVAVPLLRGGRLRAGVAAVTAGPRRWSDFDLLLMRDVVERIWPEVERARAQADARRLAAVFEQSSNFIATSAADGAGVRLNAAGLAMVGLPPDTDTATMSFGDFLSPLERIRIDTEIAPALRQTGQWSGEAEFRRFDGPGTVPVACRAFTIRDAEGATVGFATVSRDVTDERRQARALRDSEARYRELADAMPQVVWTADPDGRVDYYNRRTEEYAGFTRMRDGYYDWEPALHPDDHDLTVEAWTRAVATGEPYECEHRVQRANGDYAWHVSRGVPVRDAAGRIVKWYGTATDIDFVKRMEQTRELLIREVDHRAKNVLAVAQSIVKLTRADDIAAYVASVSGRIGALARAHTLLAREGWSGGGVRAVVDDELRALAKPGQYTLSGPDVTLDPGAVQALGMIVHELATNAVKYGALSRAGGCVRLNWARTTGGGLALDWTEAGGPPVAAPKQPGFGSTLLNELAARQLGGRLDLHWRREGLAARLELPAALLRRGAPEEEGVTEQRCAPAGAAKPRRGVVLLVEDNALIGLDAHAVLTAAGLDVIGPVADVATALQVIAHRPLDAAFLDVDLHGRTSFEIADALTARGVPFTFSTGFGRIDADSGHAGRPVLRKPVSDEALLGAYDAMVESWVI
ncbi:PAS domain-containing protein [Caulobacter sp. 17J65-9]|uniref:PAS domain-containing protein n=1 Tax=Caulobacter sp. 17J65-9 TaxID=2709382 RepID=UPI0013C75B13|nr:PAS domain-containing protein [Caulobacter sp. 17J65-9]NEX94196.1 PAS domain-containing protein [Caulobacter sp. 17J65-9]